MHIKFWPTQELLGHETAPHNKYSCLFAFFSLCDLCCWGFPFDKIFTFVRLQLLEDSWSHAGKIIIRWNPCTWYLMVALSSETAYSADDLELEWARRRCLSERSYNSVILLKAEISPLRTRSVAVTSVVAKKPKSASFFYAATSWVWSR